MQVKPNGHHPSKLAFRPRPRNRTSRASNSSVLSSRNLYISPLNVTEYWRWPRSLADVPSGPIDNRKATLFPRIQASSGPPDGSGVVSLQIPDFHSDPKYWEFCTCLERDPEDVNTGLPNTRTHKHSLLNRSAVLPFWITDSRSPEEAEISRSGNGRPYRDFVRYGSRAGNDRLETDVLGGAI